MPSFVKGNIRTPMFPAISQTLLTVPGRAGSYDFGNVIGNRTITFDYFIIYTNKADLMTKIRQFGEWLYSENAEQLELIKDPNKFYYAKVTGETSYSEDIRAGRGTVTFLCTDPYVYAAEQTQNLDVDGITTITNNGGTDATPVLEYTFNQDTTYFSVDTGNDRMVFGTAEQAGVTTPTPKRITILSDTMDTTTGWTGAIGIDEGALNGAITSQSGQFRLTTLGSGSGWHGAALTKGLSEEVQDFTLEMFVSLSANNVNQLAKIEAYLYSINDICVGKLSFTDYYASSNDPIFEARAGTLGGGNKFATTKGNVKVGSYSDFYGRLTLQRIGNKWWAEIAKRNVATNSYFGRWSKSYVGGTISKVAKVQVAIFGFGSYGLNSTCGIESLYFHKENVIDPNTQAPIIFTNGDQLIIDSAKGIVTKNGDPCYELLDGFSTFPILKKGANTITSNPLVTSGTIKFQERWLG